jgi:hypothetical protein
MRARKSVYIGGTVLVAAIVAIGAWQPLAKADGDKDRNKEKTPSFTVDASWPKPLPAPIGTDGKAHQWVQGEVAASCIDQYDNVYTFNRGWEVGVSATGFPLQGNESGAINGNDATPGGAIPSPPVVVFDRKGNTIAGFGNPSLIPTPNVDYGYAAYMPHGAHGCYVDYQGMLWVGGNGDGIVQKYNPAAAATAGASATFVMQIGMKAACDGLQTSSNPFSSCGETNDFNTSHTLLNEPPDIAVDPNVGPVSGMKGDVYIADGYGNHRIVVFNANGQYVGQWGTSCGTNSQSCPAGTFGATGGGHPHCVGLGNDGMVYVCDRPNSRIQVFSKTCAVPSTAGNPQPVCLPAKIINIGLNAGQTPPSTVTVIGNNAFQNAAAADAAAILGSTTTRSCDIDFWPQKSQSVIVNVDLNNDNTWLLDKASGLVFGALGVCGITPCPGHNAGHFAYNHTTVVDSKGSIYVAETITGRRIQKFVQSNGYGKGRDDDDDD